MGDINHEDVVKQARWELSIELFEEAVRQEKERMKSRAKRSWFPWRIKLLNVNEVKHGN